MELSNYKAGMQVEVQRQASPARDRDPNCIENHLKNIEVELAEALNSAANLADKIAGAGSVKNLDPNGNPPTPSNIQSRLEQITNAVRYVISQLERSHSAISG